MMSFITKNQYFKILSSWLHIIIFYIFVIWFYETWDKENAINYEALIGIISCLIVAVNYLNPKIFSPSHLKYYAETHESKDKSNGYYTIIAIWNCSNNKINHNDFASSGYPTINLLPGIGTIKLEKTMISSKSEDSVFTSNYPGNYILHNMYWDKNDFTILKFNHDKAILIEEVSRRHQRSYRIYIFVSGTGKKKNIKFELIEKNEFYQGRYFGNSAYALILFSICYIILTFDIFSFWASLSPPIICILFAVALMHITIPEKYEFMRAEFINLGGKRLN